MRATAWNDGGTTYGISVGPANRDRYFQRGWSHIEVEMDGQVHSIPLTGGFWNKCPEFRSPAVREWLRRHRALEWPDRKPPVVELVPLGENRFRLEA